MRHIPLYILPFFVLAGLIGGAVPIAHAASLSITPLATSGITAGKTASFYAAASGFYDPKFALTDSLGGSSVSGSDIDVSGYFSWTPVPTDAGQHLITVVATDAQGNSATSSVSIYVIPGTITLQSLSPGQTVFTNESVTLTVATPGFTNPLFSVTDAYVGSTVSMNAVSSTGSFSWTPVSNEQGVHTLTVSASDNYGHQGSATQMLTVVAPSLGIVSLLPGTSVVVGTPTTFSASTTGFTTPAFSLVDSLGYYSSVSSASLSSTTGAFSWTPVASDVGKHALTLSATDAHGNTATATTTLVVVSSLSAVPPPSAPVTTGTASTNAPTSGGVGDGFVFTKALGLGSTGIQVTELQKRLTVLGLYTGPVTGYYGALSVAAVKRFQAAHGIAQVGSVGPQTRLALNTTH